MLRDTANDLFYNYSTSTMLYCAVNDFFNN